MALANKQFLARRLATRYGVKVRVGLSRWLEDVRSPETGALVRQIPRDDGEVFEREDGVAIPAEDIAAEAAAAEADEAAALAARAATTQRAGALATEFKRNGATERLRNATPAEIDAYIDANVTDLASARGVLKVLAKAVAFLARGNEDA